MAELRVGVIGTGGMGQRHARNVADVVSGARLAAVMDIDRSRASAVAEASGATVFDDAADLVASSEVDAVIIASPDPTHAELALMCLDHAKPALVEKPLATTLDDAAAVVERESALGRRMVQVGLMRHYDPQHVAVRDAIASGRIGRPLLFRGWHRNPPDAVPPSSTDVLIQAAVHDLYSARWLLGREITEVHVRGTMIDPDRSDQLDLQLITMSMSEGAMAAIEVNKNSGFGYEVGVEVTGSSGIVSTAPHHTPVVRHGGEMRQRVEADWLERFDSAYRLEVEAWARAAASGTATGPDVRDGYVTLAAALAAAVSLESGRPVPMPSLELPGLPLR